jgi:hypothetical protein
MTRRNVMASEVIDLPRGAEDYVLIPDQTKIKMVEELDLEVDIFYQASPDVRGVEAVIAKRAVYEPVFCRFCGDQWPRHPAYEVACPKCGAGIGRPCSKKRPSGHRVVFGIGPHEEREQAAVDAGIWAKCQVGAPGHTELPGKKPEKAKPAPQPQPEKVKAAPPRVETVVASQTPLLEGV